MRNVSTFEEMFKRHILCSISFSENRDVCEMTWKTRNASLCFYCKIGYAQAPICTVIRALPILLTLNPLTWKIWWAPNYASRWQMGFNSAFKGL